MKKKLINKSRCRLKSQMSTKEKQYISHCAISSNLFQVQKTQIAIHQLSDPENKKNVALEKFWNKTPSNPATCEEETVSTLHRPCQNDIKSSRWFVPKTFQGLHFLSLSWWIAI